MNDKKLNIKHVLKTAGAFMAWVIGSGFATGQEILQFFSSYGYSSFLIVLINLLGFVVVGYLIMKTGFENKAVPHFNHFIAFCGKTTGTIYTWLTTATLLLLMPILIAGAGATLFEYYGINHYTGSAIMTVLVLSIYLIGFERMIRIISSIGPLIIIFSVLVGTITLIKDFGALSRIGQYGRILSPYQAAPNWFFSGLLYLGLNFFPGSAYFTQLGIAADSEKEVKYGALLGGSVLILSITIMSTAIMLNVADVAGLQIPVLYLARRISYVLGAVFSLALVLGIFSSSSLMMWSICSRFIFPDKKWNKLLAVFLAVFAYFISLFSFGNLVAAIYPLIGLAGLIFIACVLYRPFRKQ